MAYRSFGRSWQARHPPRYAAFPNLPSPNFGHSSWRAAPRTTPGGQPWYSPLAILTALTLRAVFRLALRQTEGLIGVRGSAPDPSPARAGSGGARSHHPVPPGRDAGGAAA